MTPAKRALDLVVAGALLVLLWPVIALIALAILLREGRPVFYLAERMKTPEQGFTLIKFRTMPLGSGDGGVTGGDKSGRLSRLQRLLRRSRADELPQPLDEPSQPLEKLPQPAGRRRRPTAELRRSSDELRQPQEDRAELRQPRRPYSFSYDAGRFPNHVDRTHR